MAYLDTQERNELPDWAPRPGPGEDWFKAVPSGVLPVFRDMALTAAALIEGWNRKLLIEVVAWNFELPEGHLTAPTLDSFGHNLAMECLGTGVGWDDDHPGHELEVPSLEVWLDATPHQQSKLLTQVTSLEDLFWRRGWKLLPDGSGPVYHEMPGVPMPFATVKVKG